MFNGNFTDCLGNFNRSLECIAPLFQIQTVTIENASLTWAAKGACSEACLTECNNFYQSSSFSVSVNMTNYTSDGYIYTQHETSIVQMDVNPNVTCLVTYNLVDNLLQNQTNSTNSKINENDNLVNLAYDVGTIIGGALGAFVLFVLIIYFGCLYRKNRKERDLERKKQLKIYARYSADVPTVMATPVHDDMLLLE